MQIQTMINAGLAAIGLDSQQSILRSTGDGAIVVLETPSDANVFAQKVQELTWWHNKARKQRTGKRLFRNAATPL